LEAATEAGGQEADKERAEERMAGEEEAEEEGNVEPKTEETKFFDIGRCHMCSTLRML
jgi:hypothetical protein